MSCLSSFQNSFCFPRALAAGDDGPTPAQGRFEKIPGQRKEIRWKIGSIKSGFGHAKAEVKEAILRDGGQERAGVGASGDRRHSIQSEQNKRERACKHQSS